ncbi:hematopoietic progenitor cell antigen CD34 [Corvus cornix cornix]|uniref:hematopoietic progenitor cell antigen CD34 n=1 Tax=Corvus cornix cornix TaxID=932674 RepID=UPI0019505FD5|nr:hematopoietic progenitor cell antigen CD34 [Corvus cornix cornix]
MQWGQLLCIAACLVQLAGSGARSTTPTPAATGVRARDTSGGTASGATNATTATRDASSAKPTSAQATVGSVATSLTSSGVSGQLSTSPQPNPAPTSPPGTSLEAHGSSGVPTTQSPLTQPRDQAETSGSVAAGTNSAATSEHPPVPAATTALHAARASPKPPSPAITCHSARDEGDTGAICLQLNQSSTCEHFLERKGSDLWQALCENGTYTVDSSCEIKLIPSSLDRDCLLLILRGEKDPDKLLNMLQKSHWEKFGIESLKKESARGRRDSSQKTLIALVTSGLLLAFLGLAGYFLMRRRSWSPAGERLAEDPYYTENGSQGNTMLMSPSQEPAELQEKPNLPNLNGGTQENGTGQASSKNSHSARQHSPADTEM